MKTKNYVGTLVGIAAILSITLFGFAPEGMNPGVVYEIETTYHSSSSAEMMRMSVHGPHLFKMETVAGEEANEEVVFRGDRREMIVVDHERKSYMIIDEEMAQAMGRKLEGAMDMAKNFQIPESVLKNMSAEQRKKLEEAQKQMGQGRLPNGPDLKTEYKRTSERATKAGYPCVKYDGFRGGEKVSELWVTDWDNVKGGNEVRDVFTEMADFVSGLMRAFGDMMGNDGAGWFGSGQTPFGNMKEVNGFPVVTRSFEGGELESESVLRSAKRRTLDPAEFEPPAGYKRQQMGPR